MSPEPRVERVAQPVADEVDREDERRERQAREGDDPVLAREQVFVANADGTNARQITSLGQANWAPNFMPDGNIIFCSNHEYKRGFPFNMYTVDENGKDLKKISRDKGFDAFPMFSPNGKKILFCSNRNNGGTRDTNVFVADWNQD